MVDVFLVAYFALILSVLGVSFLYVYILSRRFERYAKTKSYYFPISISLGLAGSVFLAVSVAMRPDALALGSKIPLTYAHVIGELLLFLMVLFLYRMTIEMVSALSGRRASYPTVWVMSVSAFVSGLYYTVALLSYSPLDSLLMAIDFVAAVGVIFLLMLSLVGVREISRRILAGSDVYICSLLFFLSYQLFYQVHAFLSKVIPMALPVGYADTMNALRIAFTVVPAVFAVVLSFRVIRPVMNRPEIPKMTDKKLIPFLDEVSQLIGESTMTIYRYGMEDYRKTFPGGKENDELYQYLVRYFEDYIGPVSARIAREIETGEKEKSGTRLRTGPYKDN
jgi:hypothetical protein